MNIILALLCIIGLYVLQLRLTEKYWKKNLDISLHFSHPSAREGERLQLYEVVSNRKFLPLPVLRVKFSASRHLLFDDQRNSQISDQFYRNDILSVMMYQRITRALDFTCSRRGFYTINRIDAVSSDMFLSRRMVDVVPCNLTLSVYPRLLDGEQFDTLFRQMFGTILAKRVINEDPFEFRGIREYQPFDSMRSVNFKASAKTGSLKVNQHDYTTSQRVRILLNLELETIWQYDDLLEESIRLASTLAGEFIAHGIPVSLESNGCDLMTGKPISVPAGSGQGHVQTIDEALCRIDTNLKMPAFLPIINTILEDSAPEDTLILISTFQRADFLDALEQLRAENIPLFWLVPLHDDMPLTAPDSLSDCLLRWHVDRVL